MLMIRMHGRFRLASANQRIPRGRSAWPLSSWFVGASLILQSCTWVSIPLQPVNPTVADRTQSQTCRVVVFGLPGHSHDIEPVMRKGGIRRVHSAEYWERTFMGCGQECVVVQGE
ncbi:MAG TPA: hypothetical protein VFS39_10385 [Nitrospira sp.]|nr:hypothetical protein [Nitrospira sp.]